MKATGPYRAWLVEVDLDEHGDVVRIVHARSRSEARGEVARDLADAFDCSFGEAVQRISRAVREPWEDRQDREGLRQVRRQYGVPAHVGRPVRLHGEAAVVTGYGEGLYVWISVGSGREWGMARMFHPTDPAIDYSPAS